MRPYQAVASNRLSCVSFSWFGSFDVYRVYTCTRPAGWRTFTFGQKNPIWHSQNHPCLHLLESFERELSIKIPESYRSFMIEVNGGCPDHKAFSGKESSGFVLQQLYPIGSEHPFESANMNRYDDNRKRLLHIGMSICGDDVVIPLQGRKRGSIA